MDASTILSLIGGVAGNIAAPGVGGMVGSQAGKAVGGAIDKKKGGSSGGTSAGGDKATGLSAGMGILQQIQAAKLKNKADSNFPELIDPNQSAFLTEIDQKRKSIDTGADFAAGMSAIDASNAATNDALTKVTGGDIGGTVQALLQSERAAGDSKNAVLAQGQQQQLAYNSVYQNMLNDISERKMQLQLARSQQYRAEWAKKQQQANQNVMAALGRSVSSGQQNDNLPGTPAPAEVPTTGKYTDLLKLQGDINNINGGAIDDASVTLPGNIA